MSGVVLYNFKIFLILLELLRKPSYISQVLVKPCWETGGQAKNVNSQNKSQCVLDCIDLYFQIDVFIQYKDVEHEKLDAQKVVFDERNP